MNQLTRRGPREAVRQNTHPAFLPQTRDMVAAYGLTPGLPQPFRYVERRQHPTYTSAEYVNIWPQQEAGIAQLGYREPIIGDFNSMVYDVPFDPVHTEDLKQNLAKYGLAAILLGTLWFKE